MEGLRFLLYSSGFTFKESASRFRNGMDVRYRYEVQYFRIRWFSAEEGPLN